MDGDGDCQIVFIVVGDGQNIMIFWMFEVGQQQVVGYVGIGGQGGGIGFEVLQVEFLDV